MITAEEETRLIREYAMCQATTRALYAALICARVGVVEWRGDRYALTWDAGES